MAGIKGQDHDQDHEQDHEQNQNQRQRTRVSAPQEHKRVAARRGQPRAAVPTQAVFAA